VQVKHLMEGIIDMHVNMKLVIRWISNGGKYLQRLDESSMKSMCEWISLLLKCEKHTGGFFDTRYSFHFY
jgi:hypothetical protein